MSAISRRSLCCTCLYEEGCLQGGSLDRPVVHCELFDCGRRARSGPRASVSGPALLSAAETTTRALGLCVNCDLRHDCALHRPEGGVWHCEEYR